MTYIGYYNELGYWIGESNKGQLQEIFAAGNNPQDSGPGVSLPVGDKQALPLEVIRQHCKRTGKYMAEENGVEWGGIEYEEI